MRTTVLQEPGSRLKIIVLSSEPFPVSVILKTANDSMTQSSTKYLMFKTVEKDDSLDMTQHLILTQCQITLGFYANLLPAPSQRSHKVENKYAHECHGTLQNGVGEMGSCYKFPIIDKGSVATERKSSSA